MTDIVPDLPVIRAGEVYARLTEQAMNCRGDTHGIATDLTWYFQSIKKLGEGDLMIIGGNWVMQDMATPAYAGNNGSPIDLWIAAMKRGAKIAVLTSYAYTGNPDDCDGTAPSALDHSDWGGTGIANCTECGSPKYTTCHVACCTIKKLRAANEANFIDLRNTAPLGGATSHSKFASFYYFKRNEFGQFFGAWNPVIRYWPLKETGFGLYGKLNEGLGKLCNHWMYTFLTMVKNISSEKDNFNKIQQMIAVLGVPDPPVKVPTLFFYGPDYCDPNFGCQMTDQAGTPSRNDCSAAQKYVTLVDHDVEVTLGVAPSLLHHTPSCVGDGFTDWGKGWGGKGDKLVDALTLMEDFIAKSKQFVKSSEMTQYMGNGTASDDSMNCSQDQTPKGLVTALTESMKAGKPYLAIEGGSDGDYNASGGDGCNKWGSKDSMALAWRFACDDAVKKNFAIKGYGYGNTHDKFWVSDNALILSTGHPDTGFHMGMAYNYWIEFAKCPNLTVWMNNHWNSMWQYCCSFPQYDNKPNSFLQKAIGDNVFYKDLSSVACPKSATLKNGCCFGDPSQNIYAAKGNSYPSWYGVPDLDSLRGGENCKTKNCPVHSSCSIVDKKAVCNCDDDYTKDSKGDCVQKSTCKGMSCPGNSSCVIVDGKAVCICDPGFIKDADGDCTKPKSCEDITCPPHSTCVNNKDTIQCQCDEGYNQQRDGTCVASSKSKWPVAIGVILGIALVLFLVIYFLKRRKRRVHP